MKDMITKEYYRWIRKILKAGLSEGTPYRLLMKEQYQLLGTEME